VNALDSHSQRVQTQSRAARSQDKAKRKESLRKRAKRVLAECFQRLAFTPFECGVLLGKSATFVYRQIYAGRIKPISDAGRMMIPRSELDRFLARTAHYNPQSKTKGEADENGGEA
jgi:helix-turn-helix protein